MSRRRPALALAAGGARGAYQAGALLFLAEQGIRFDAASGTSIGSLNGAFYVGGDGSSGHLSGLVELWRKMAAAGLLRHDGASVTRYAGRLLRAGLGSDLVALITTLLGRGFSLVDPLPVAEVLDEWLDYDAVRSSSVPLWIAVLEETAPVADIVLGSWRSAHYLEARNLSAEELRQALLAATAIPLAFPSRTVGGARYADAALADPVPAWVHLTAGVDSIWSIFLSDHSLQDRRDFQGVQLFQVRPSRPIDTGLASVFDFSLHAIEDLISLGYADARATFTEAWEIWESLVELKASGTLNQDAIGALERRLRSRREE